MTQISVINTIAVPPGMEAQAESVRDEYVRYFSQQPGFVSSTFYQAIKHNENGELQYVNIVVWQSYADFEKVVNSGFDNELGGNQHGKRVLGKGFPPSIRVFTGQYQVIAQNHTDEPPPLPRPW